MILDQKCCLVVSPLLVDSVTCCFNFFHAIVFCSLQYIFYFTGLTPAVELNKKLNKYKKMHCYCYNQKFTHCCCQELFRSRDHSIRSPDRDLDKLNSSALESRDHGLEITTIGSHKWQIDSVCANDLATGVDTKHAVSRPRPILGLETK